MPRTPKDSEKKVSTSKASDKTSNKSKNKSANRKSKSKSNQISKKHAETLKDSIDNLTFAMKNIYDLFSKASDEMYEEHDLHFERVAPLTTKLDELIEQNKSILTTIKSLFEEIRDLKKREIELEKVVESSLLVKDLRELKQVKEDDVETKGDSSTDKMEIQTNLNKTQIENQLLNSGPSLSQEEPFKHKLNQ